MWSPACQDHVAGGHAGVGVVSLGGASPFSSFLVLLLSSRSFTGWAGLLRTTLPTGKVRSGSSFCCLRLSGSAGGC